MIIFQGTKKIGLQSFMVFTNEFESVIQIPVDEDIQSMFLHYFDRLNPQPKKWTSENLLSAINNGTEEDRIDAMKKAGIIDSDGNIIKPNWKSKVTRTSVF